MKAGRFNDWTNLVTTKRYFEAITRKNGNMDLINCLKE